MSFFRLPGGDDPPPAHTTGKGVDRGRRIGIVLWKVIYRKRIRGLARVPAGGPLVVVANHTNYVDGGFLFAILPRRVSFLVKAEAITGPLGRLLTHVGQYAIKRDVPDRRPLIAALEHLKAGGAIGVFPEGTRGAGNVTEVFNGAGWLAVRAGATVLPVAIRGTARPPGARRRFRPVVNVLVGTPFDVPAGAGKAAVDAATARIQQRLSLLVSRLDAELAGRAAHAGQAPPGAIRSLASRLPLVGRRFRKDAR